MRRSFALVVPILLLSALGAFAVKVERKSVQVMGGPGSFYPKVASLKGGDDVEVIGDKGAWSQIRIGSTKGFIPTSALAAKKGGKLGRLSRSFGSSEASVSSETAGVKGFNEGVEKEHAKNRKVDWGAVKKLERQQVTPAAMQAFLRKRVALTEASR